MRPSRLVNTPEWAASRRLQIASRGSATPWRQPPCRVGFGTGALAVQLRLKLLAGPEVYPERDVGSPEPARGPRRLRVTCPPENRSDSPDVESRTEWRKLHRSVASRTEMRNKRLTTASSHRHNRYGAQRLNPVKLKMRSGRSFILLSVQVCPETS